MGITGLICLQVQGHLENGAISTPNRVLSKYYTREHPRRPEGLPGGGGGGYRG